MLVTILTFSESWVVIFLLVWNISRMTKMWHRDTKWASAVGKMAPVDLLDAGLPQTFNFLKMRYLWSTMRWGLPICTDLRKEFLAFIPIPNDPGSPPVQTQSTRNGLDDMIHEITMGFFPKIFSPLCSHDPHHRSALHGANKHLQQRRELSVFSLILAAQISSKDPMYDRNRGQLSGKYFHSITEKKCKLGGWMAF